MHPIFVWGIAAVIAISSLLWNDLTWAASDPVRGATIFQA